MASAADGTTVRLVIPRDFSSRAISASRGPIPEVDRLLMEPTNQCGESPMRVEMVVKVRKFLVAEAGPDSPLPS